MPDSAEAYDRFSGSHISGILNLSWPNLDRATVTAQQQRRPLPTSGLFRRDEAGEGCVGASGEHRLKGEWEARPEGLWRVRKDTKEDDRAVRRKSLPMPLQNERGWGVGRAGGACRLLEVHLRSVSRGGRGQRPVASVGSAVVWAESFHLAPWHVCD